MQALNDDGLRQLLGEDFVDHFTVIEEYITEIHNDWPMVKKKLAKIDALEVDMETIKRVFADTNRDVQDHENRIRKLELKAD